MRDRIIGQVHTNCQMATTTLNLMIEAVYDRAGVGPDNRPKHYCDLLVLGYGNDVRPLLGAIKAPVGVPDLPGKLMKDKRMVQIIQTNPVTQQAIAKEELRPCWVQPEEEEPNRPASSKTEMAKAISDAREAVQSWLGSGAWRPKSFPPVVINITDGQHNGEGNPLEEANQLRQLRTEDGNVLLFNCHLVTRASAQSLGFPHQLSVITAMGLPELERIGAQQLFEMSSVIPQKMAERFKTPLKPGARGFIYNADPQDLVDFLSWGTQNYNY
jgi:hypothetical protein